MFNTAVVIGKFYPPHKGHKYLIDAALTQAKQVTVIVCAQETQMISGALRTQWIKAIHPTAHVMMIDDIYPDDDSELWARLTIQWLGYVPDAVFSSEDYGPIYAKCMGSAHVMVDRQRVAVPISGTKVRNNPLEFLEFLEPCVKAYFVKRICIVGAESTGTTTLAQALAEHYKTAWVPEYGRMYSEGKLPAKNGTTWDSGEFAHIAHVQSEMEDALAERANKVLICDTNAFATSIWHQRYMHNVSEDLETMAKNRKYDLYIVTGDEIPFVQDGTRDGEHIRHWMHNLFIAELQTRRLPHILASGTPEQRKKIAIEKINQIVQEK